MQDLERRVASFKCLPCQRKNLHTTDHWVSPVTDSRPMSLWILFELMVSGALGWDLVVNVDEFYIVHISNVPTQCT